MRPVIGNIKIQVHKKWQSSVIHFLSRAQVFLKKNNHRLLIKNYIGFCKFTYLGGQLDLSIIKLI